MADAAPVIAPISNTAAGDGSNLQTFEQWNPQQWFDTNRWTLTGSQADSDYKAGMWWSDAQDMKAAVPALLKHADSWTTGRGQLTDAQQKARTAKAELAGYTGASAKANSDQLDRIDKALQARMDSVEPIPAALRNTAAIINDGFPKMQALWDKWENDRANAPQCDADTQQMQPVISNMAQSMLDSANAIMVAYHTELTPPEITNGPPSNDTTDATATTQSAAAPATQQIGGAQTISGIGSAAKAGTAPGTLVTPVAAHIHGPALAGTTAAAATPAAHAPSIVHSVAAAHGTATAHVTAAGNAASAATASTPQLAGTGSATLTPPTLAGSASPVTAGAAAAPGAAGGIPAVGLTPSGGMAPFVPVAPTGGTARQRRDDKRDEQSGTVMPVTGGVRGGGKARPTIRPGTAKRTGSTEAAATIGGLRGRTRETAATEAKSTRRRTGKKEQSRSTVQFLDEDAWQTDDPGSGVLSSKPLHE